MCVAIRFLDSEQLKKNCGFHSRHGQAHVLRLQQNSQLEALQWRFSCICQQGSMQSFNMQLYNMAATCSVVLCAAGHSSAVNGNTATQWLLANG